MSDLERITGLIGEIYDAALDGNLWPQVLRHMMMLLHGVSAAIFSESELSNDRLCCEVAVEPAFTESCVRLLAPHLQRALAIARSLERSESKSAALGEVLERLSSAVIFVDREGRLVHANEPAAQILAMSDVLSWANGRPRPRDERAAAHLDTILASAHRGQACPGRGVLPVSHCTQSGARVTVHVLPLSSGASRHVAATCAAAAAIVVSQQTW